MFFLEVLNVGLSKQLVLEMIFIRNTRSSLLRDVDEEHWNRLPRGWIFMDGCWRAAGWLKLCLASWSGCARAPSRRRLDQSSPEVPAVTMRIRAAIQCHCNQNQIFTHAVMQTSFRGCSRNILILPSVVFQQAQVSQCRKANSTEQEETKARN